MGTREPTCGYFRLHVHWMSITDMGEMDRGTNKGSDLVLLKLNVRRVESDHVMSYGVTLKCFSGSCSAYVRGQLGKQGKASLLTLSGFNLP